MSVILALDISLAVLVLAVAVWTIVSREAFAAVVGYVAYGLLVSLVWVRLFAVDVALTEAAIGSGVTGVLLISAAVRLRGTEAAVAAEWPGAGSRLLAAALCIVVTAALAAVVLMMPDPGATLAPEAARHLAATELGNPVTAVLMAFRALDTLLEKVVLFLAVIGVWSLAADGNWGGIAGPRRATHRQGALAFLAQLLPPVGIVVAIHIVWVGANEPGGAFQGGAILAAMWLIVIMARLAEAPAIGGRRLRLALIAGPAVFLAVGLLGFAVAGAFLAYPAGLAKPLIVFIEVFMTLSIAVSLPMLVLGPPDRPAAHECADPRRTDGRRAGRPWPLRPARPSPSAAQAPRLQPAGQRRLPAVRHHRPQGRGRGLRRRSGAAGAGHHRHRRRLLRDGACGRPAAAAVRGPWLDDVAPGRGGRRQRLT